MRKLVSDLGQELLCEFLLLTGNSQPKLPRQKVEVQLILNKQVTDLGLTMLPSMFIALFAPEIKGSFIFMSGKQDPKKHHYVPQFYLRKFSCKDDENKVPSISRHNHFLIKKPCSIGRIGYEDYLYRVTDNEIEVCIEKELNRNIETPFSQSDTWKKIEDKAPELLSKNDKLTLYIFMRHLESRNIENLEFLKAEQQRVKQPRYKSDYSESERRLHLELGLLPNGVEHFYLGVSGNIYQYFEAFKNASISIWGSKIPIRTSTNPVINVPIHTFHKTEFDPNNTAKWLPLSPNLGAMLFMNEKYCDFGGYQVVEDDVIKVLNRLYLIQLLKSRTTRHMIASDNFIDSDFEWAGIAVDPDNPRKFKCPT